MEADLKLTYKLTCGVLLKSSWRPRSHGGAKTFTEWDWHHALFDWRVVSCEEARFYVKWRLLRRGAKSGRGSGGIWKAGNTKTDSSRVFQVLDPSLSCKKVTITPLTLETYFRPQLICSESHAVSLCSSMLYTHTIPMYPLTMGHSSMCVVWSLYEILNVESLI